ncbi:siderophore-interacting protein [Microbacterium sp. cx-59]|uniref:siderophore-interacting protein n=1 Tax=Microbacterium sp. cx-59 TaxID=2891207 RepID=UPI001E4BC0F4|nr:siderophore-interacting protein [Microbacterium sp. cx-59]MCC4907018.1 siderophore-interacting protein [Microbacterium sp. cx-59]
MIPSRRTPSAQTTLDVLETAWLTPGLVRVTLGGEQFSAFPDRPETDKYAKLYFPPEGSTLKPPYDLAALREQVPFDQLPTVRTYTIRQVDHDRRTIDIDFVVHGDTGVAGPWAASAQPGDRLTMSSPGGGYSPDLDADERVLIGDESAIPAIASALESLPSGVSAIALIETRSTAHRVTLAGNVTWVDEQHDAPGANLVTAVEALPWPAGRVQVFAHGERGAMKALRPLFTARGVARTELSLSAYWAAGRTEDAFQAEKRLPVGQIFPA